MLALYTWFPLVILVAIYILIARFYQRFSGRTTAYWYFAIPVIFYGASFVRYASIQHIAGDVWGDMLGAVGGVSLMVLSVSLTIQMLKQNQS